VYYDYGRIFSVEFNEFSLGVGDLQVETDCGWVYLELVNFSHDLGSYPIAIDCLPVKTNSDPRKITSESRHKFIGMF
jgi:hypothetical protein